jgi:hypothetical protein
MQKRTESKKRQVLENWVSIGRERWGALDERCFRCRFCMARANDWKLSEATSRTPVDCYATIVALSARRSRITARSAISFIVEDEVTIVGMFSQNGFQTIKTRRHRFRQRPGVYETAAELIAALLLAYWMPSHPR